MPELDPAAEHNRQILERINSGEQTVSSQINPTEPLSPKPQNPGGPGKRQRPTFRSLTSGVADGLKTAAKFIWKGSKIIATALAPLAPFMLIILVIFVIISVIFSFFGLSGYNGGGPADYPKTAAERQVVTEVQALSGDIAANAELLNRAISAQKKRVDTIKAALDQVYKNNPSQIAAAKEAINSIVTDLDLLSSETDLAKKKALIKQINQKIGSFMRQYREVAGLAAVNGGYLPVPGIGEAFDSECGLASMVMIIVYYNPDFRNPDVYDPETSLTGKTAAQGGDEDPLGGPSCPINPSSVINEGGQYKDWTWANKSDVTPEEVKKSLAAGDPVMVYTRPGGIYKKSKHIFVLVGYDPEDDTFIVNNPKRGGVEAHTKTPNGVKMTVSHLWQYLAPELYNGHCFLIRKAHI